MYGIWKLIGIQYSIWDWLHFIWTTEPGIYLYRYLDSSCLFAYEVLEENVCCKIIQPKIIPTIVADKRETKVPAIIAFKPSSVRSLYFLGARIPIPAT